MPWLMYSRAEEILAGVINPAQHDVDVRTIDSPELARQITQHFDELSRPANCYIPVLGPPDALANRTLSWRTE
jgi:hypothetical protein